MTLTDLISTQLVVPALISLELVCFVGIVIKLANESCDTDEQKR